jgi:23S rRNA (guanosine2251-2'-O)-methyltransferase
MAEVVMPWASEEDVVAYAQLSNSALIIVCDHVTDTRNLGAIARSAAYFGAKFIVMPKDRQAPITSATLSAAQGAFALIRPIQVTNISRFLREIQGHGFWVAVADMNGQNVDEMPHTYEKLALVLGSETRGVSKIVRELADMTLSVVPPAPLLESLNVSVASAVLLHSLTKPRRSQSKSNQ